MITERSPGNDALAAVARVELRDSPRGGRNRQKRRPCVQKAASILTQVDISSR